MDRREIERLISDLAVDEIRNCSILNFVRENRVLSIDRVGGSVLVRGRSDRDWVYASSSDPSELRLLARRLSEGDDHYAAIEPWMVPILRRDRDIAWNLPMVRFTLPDSAALPDLEGAAEPLSPDDASNVYEHSNYAEFISPEYARSRILAGPAVGVRENGVLVAWGMTQDDGAMGFLHVIDKYRNRGYGRRITIALAAELRRRNRRPFAYISETNSSAISLVTALGFERGEAIQWFRLQ
jgi:ribosomal protein S18 acetylase RimI-like enzyme